jgi:hypothetical protein
VVQSSTLIIRGDVLESRSLDEALQGVHTAYYLVHLLSGAKDFEKEDRLAASNFAAAWATTLIRNSLRTFAVAMRLEACSETRALKPLSSRPGWSLGPVAVHII